MTTKNKKSPLEWGEFACNSLMNTFEPSQLPPKGRYHYHQGVFLLGMEQCYRQNHDEAFNNYIIDWLNSIIDTDGNLTECDAHQFDDIQPSMLLYRLLDEGNYPQYETVLHTLLPPFKEWPVSPEGGFWHKSDCDNQLWLDTLFMAGPVAVNYGKRYDDEDYYDLISHQAKLIYNHMRDKRSGLLYHAWDSSKKASWANPDTGCSSEFWGRAMGWVPVALVEILTILPEDHKDYDTLVDMLQDILKSLVPFQDESGLWYQVLDRGDDPDNWLELSCSSLFVYALAKAVRMNLMHPVYLKYAYKGYEGIIGRLTVDAKGNLCIPDICIGTGVGDYNHYLNRPTQVNDLHGVGTFAMMCAEINLAVHE